MPLTTARLTAIAGISRDALNKIMAPERGGLRTPVSYTIPGAARIFSRETGLEVAFIAALGRVGMAAAEARKISYTWVGKALQGELADYWAWNPGQGDSEGAQLEFAQAIPHADLAFMLADSGPDDPGRPAAAVVLIDRGEIVRRVDEAL
jgi:hypothetical protein